MDEHKTYRDDTKTLVDPSTLTTQQLWREIASLKELLLSHVDRIDTAVKVAHDDLVRVPTEVQKSVAALKELTWVRLDDLEELVKQRFNLVETSRVEQKTDTATAVTAALNAAKEAVAEQNKSNTVAIAKSEASTTKLLDQLTILINTTASGLEGKINDVKDRLTTIEGRSSGRKDFWGYIIGGIGLIATLITVFYFLSQHFVK
jgi:hypothetical protein